MAGVVCPSKFALCGRFQFSFRLHERLSEGPIKGLAIQVYQSNLTLEQNTKFDLEFAVGPHAYGIY